VREQDCPAVADSVMECDRPLIRFGGEVWDGVVDAQAHCCLLRLLFAPYLWAGARREQGGATYMTFCICDGITACLEVTRVE
jgi:hypothetical protein